MRRSTGKPRRLDRGVALIEVMVACLLFVIGALGVMAYLAYGRVALVREGRSRIAAQIAHSRIEALRTAAYDNLEAHAESDVPVDLGGVVGRRETAFDSVDEDGDEATDYKRARVRVSWIESDIPAEVELVTLFAPTE